MALNFGSTPAFGATASTGATNFGFGTQPTTTKPGDFGTNLTFGASTNAPAFGLGTNPQTTASTSFGFGGGFGTTATSQPTGFGGFGTTSTAVTSTTFSGFGAPAATTSTGFFGFGSNPATTTSAPSLFSGFGQPSTGLSTFGTKPLSFGQSQPAFGLGSTLGQGLGQPQQQQQQQQQQQGLEQVTQSVFNCAMFGDENDKILSKLNYLQACWGTGKGFYNTNAPPVEYSKTNPFFRFKSIVYSTKPISEIKDGLVALQFNKKDEDIRKQQDGLKTTLTTLLGNKPNLNIHIDSIRPISDVTCFVFIYVEENVQNGPCKRISNIDLSNFLLQQKSQLENIGVCGAFPFSSPDVDQIKEYLNVPPLGVDPIKWKEAQEKNPNPNKLIPVPVMGFSEVKWRYHSQVDQTKRHEAFLDRIAEDISMLKSDNESSRLKLLEYKQKIADTDHRVLKLMVKHQTTRNMNLALQPEEEVMKSRLDSVKNQLNAPQLCGRLSELLTQVKMHKEEGNQENPNAYKMADTMQEEIKQFLGMQQEGIKSLIDIMQADMSDLKGIEMDLEELKKRH